MDSPTPLYGCWLLLSEITKVSECDWIRWVELPFVPHVGMEIRFDKKNRQANGWDFHVRQVVYYINGNYFECSGREEVIECPCKPKDHCCGDNKSWMEEAGWELCARRVGGKRHFVFKGMFGKKPKNGDLLKPNRLKAS